MLDIGLDINEPDDAAKISRLAQLDDEVSGVLDMKLGRSFGNPATSAARIVSGSPSYGQTVLLLPEPIRSVTAIAITGTTPETMVAADYVLWNRTRRGDYHGINRIDGYAWPHHDGNHVITVTGQWSDDTPGGAVPDEIIAAATFVLVEEWRLRQSSPAGEIGPDGMATRARNPWKFEVVKTAIEQYGAARPVVSF